MEKELAYYITLFKIKGHSTFRQTVHTSADGFKNDKNMSAQVTETVTYRVDRLTGKIKLMETKTVV